VALALLIAAAALPACEEAPREAFPDEPAPAPRDAAADLPDALLVRFQEVTGSGFSRESWELEVLQMGSDVRVRGTVRTAGASVPVYRPMDAAEFAEFWGWIRAYPLDGYRVKEDPEAPAPGWRKRLKVDVVLGPEDRWLSNNEWTRTPVDAAWLASIEDRLHLLMLDLAEAELDRRSESPEEPTEAGSAVHRALEALGDAHPQNVPGGSPNAN
jgi:hypothetical protein